MVFHCRFHHNYSARYFWSLWLCRAPRSAQATIHPTYRAAKMITTLPPFIDRLEEDLDDLRWQEFERARLKRDNDACGYCEPEEEGEDSDL